MEIEVRQAVFEDWPIIAEFNRRLAAESEAKHLDQATVEAGVRALLSAPSKGRYFVARIGNQPAGQLMHTHEWSDWRNGDLWWLQSVYVVPEFRRRGVFRALFERLLGEARADPGVVGVRLYLEEHNDAAREVYRKLGMHGAGYTVMEQMGMQHDKRQSEY